jgi:hypothetical protein
MATSTSALLKSTKISAMGRKMVDVPNPATVPITIEIKAAKRNNNSITISLI